MIFKYFDGHQIEVTLSENLYTQGLNVIKNEELGVFLSV